MRSPRAAQLRPQWRPWTALTAVVLLATAVLLAGAAGRAHGQDHYSCEADDGHPCCVIRIPVELPAGSIINFGEIGRIFPEWEAVERGDPNYLAGLTPSVILEGTVVAPTDSNDVDTGPHLAFEDAPFSHRTHDFTFDVLPDPPYQHLLGIRQFGRTSPGVQCSINREEICVPSCPLEPPPELTCPPPCFLQPPDNECVLDGGPCLVCPAECTEFPDGTCIKTPGVAACENFSCADILPLCGHIREIRQEHMEVEWESGVGADNNSNPCHTANEAGNSCGFFSAGHRRRELFWHWPTVGDHVHVEGY